MYSNKYKFLTAVLCLALATVFPVFASARQVDKSGIAPNIVSIADNQTAAFIPLEDLKLDSKLMARAMPYRVLLPGKYSSENQSRFPVIYLLHGLTGHFDNWADKTKLAEYLAAYNFIVVMPEGDNGWYTDSATVANDKYESYIVKELIPAIDKNYRTLSNRDNRIIAGLSMGGYGSIKYGLKYPEMFGLVGSFSGALQAASLTEKMLGNGWKALTASITSVYGAEDSNTRRENDPFKIVREMPAEKFKTLPFFYVSCGTEDGLIGTNREFSALLLEKKIPHEFRESPGIHNWVFWDAQVQEFLRLTDRMSNKSKAKTAG